MSCQDDATPLARAEAFAGRVGLRLPILLAPMAGAYPPSLSIAVANAGGMGACGALLMQPEAIRSWVEEFRSQSRGGFQVNLWIPGAPAQRDADAEERVRRFLSVWGPGFRRRRATRSCRILLRSAQRFSKRSRRRSPPSWAFTLRNLSRR